MFINDIFKIFNIEHSQLNVTAVKSLIAAMVSRDICYQEKQKLIFDEQIFINCWSLYSECLKYFDPNYNRKTDFSSFFKYVIDYIMLNRKINFHALFCPGYTKNGYKSYLGNTTIWKLKTLREIVNLFYDSSVDVSMTCYYSDVFLENCDSLLEPEWQSQLNYNRMLFHLEGSKYFDSNDVKNASDISIFSSEKDGEGFIDRDIIASLPKTTYESFVKSNEKFYSSMGFSNEQMKFRNDRLITMYRLFSNYLNSHESSIFLPMENMYERENIFSENGTCTMYLKLRK